MEQVRVAVIKNNYTPFGGGEKYTTRLIQAFADKGARIDVLTAKSQKWDDLGRYVRQVPLNQLKANNLLRLITFNASVSRHLEGEEYHVVFGMDRTDTQTHLRAGSGLHQAWLKRRGEETSALRRLTFRLNPYHWKMIDLERRAFHSDKLKRIFCNSDMVKGEISRHYPGIVSKLMVVHNGVEWREFATPFERGRVNKEKIMRGLNLTPGKFYFLFVGSGYERKGLAKAIRALALLPNETELIVVGKDKNEQRYKNIAGRSGLNKRVHFFGPRIDVVPFLQLSDAFILPTIYDPFSNASLEALAMGLFTVTSSGNGCAEVIEEGAGAVIDDLRDDGSVATAMGKALGPHLTREEIRDSVREFDFLRQLDKIINTCLDDAGLYP